jgi:hypothetical protein
MSAGPVPSRKIVIPHPTSPDQHLTGILELRAPPPSLESSSSSAGRKKKVALVRPFSLASGPNVLWSG